MSSAQALVPKNMNTNLCNNTYLFSPPTAAALEQYTSFQILYHCIIVSLYHCIFAPSFITNIVISYFSFDKLFLIWQYQEYFTLTCKNTFRGQSRKQACLWLPLDGFLWNSTKCQQHNCELSWNISIYLSIYLTEVQAHKVQIYKSRQTEANSRASTKWLAGLLVRVGLLPSMANTPNSPLL